MMNEILGVTSFDRMVSKLVFDGEYYNAYVTVYIGSYLAGKDSFTAYARSRNQFKALGYAIVEIGKQIQVAKRGEP